MINLLKPEAFLELKAARTNVRLRRYVLLTLSTLGVIGGIYAFSFYTADATIRSATANAAAAEQDLKSYEDIKNTAKSYQANLAVAKKILGSQVTFSTFLTDLASTLPSSTVLTQLSLSTKSIGNDGSGKPSTTELVARAKSYADVLALKTSLEKKTSLFSQVRIASTTMDSAATSQDALAKTYPYMVTFSVVIAPQGGGK